MVDIKKLCETLSLDEMTVKSILEAFFKELGHKYRDNSAVKYLLNDNKYSYFNEDKGVEKFLYDYNNFHPVVKAYINELVNMLVEHSRRYGASIYTPYWEDTYYVQGRVRDGSSLNGALIEFCKLTNASDEVLTAIFNMATEKLTDLEVAWGGIDINGGMSNCDVYYANSTRWVFQSYEEFKKKVAKVLYIVNTDEVMGVDIYYRYKDYITEKDEEIVLYGKYKYSELSDKMKNYIRELVKECDWAGNEKFYVYAKKFELELEGFGNGNEDDYIDVIAAAFFNDGYIYESNNFVDSCRTLMHTTKEGKNYCCIKYEKEFEELSQSEKETVLTKVINRCFKFLKLNRIG